MRRPQLCAIILTLTSLFALHVPVLTHAGVGAPVRILFAGMYHGADIEALNGEQWWAVSLDGKELASLNVRLETVWDPIVDDDDEATGKQVTLPEGREALFLVRGLPGLRQGPVHTAFTGHRGIPVSSVTPLVGPDSDDYQLHLDCEDAVKVNDNERLCPLRLSDAESEQVLDEFPVFFSPKTGEAYTSGEGGLVLMWAGDLDGDGRLDLLLEMSKHYNMSNPTLFLSSAAMPGEMVGRVAELVITGC